MNRLTKAIRVCLAALGAVLCLAGLVSSSLAADAPRDANSKSPEQRLAGQASPSSRDPDKAKQRKNAAKKAAKKPVKNANSPPEEQESAALALVAAHHPELLDLLQQLKTDNSKQYQRAIAELSRASQRLSDRQAKDPARYELELRAWKLDSQARLLAAKLTMDAKPELEEQLKAVLVEREDVAIAMLDMERNRLTDRLKQVERQLDNRREQHDARAQRAFDQLKRRAGKPRAKSQAAKDAQAAAKQAKQEQGKARNAAQLKADVDQQNADRNQASQDGSAVVKP